MAWNEVNVLWNMRADIADDGGLDRTGVRKDRALPQVRRHLGCKRAECADRRAENDEIRAANCVACALIHLIRKFKSANGGAGRLGPGAGRNPRREIRPAHRMTERRADKADANQRDVLKHWFCHESFCYPRLRAMTSTPRGKS